MPDPNRADIPGLKRRAQAIRRDIIEMLAAAGSGHPGGSLSATDIVTFDGATWKRIGMGATDPRAALSRYFGLVGRHDYVGINAYLPFDAALAEPLAAARAAIRDRTRAATMFGYGPRYLHSTGQLHKGGPNSGAFLIVTADPAPDLPIPGEKYSFGTLELAQALGDFTSLEATGRRVVRVHLSAPTAQAVAQACTLIQSALPAAH